MIDHVIYRISVYQGAIPVIDRQEIGEQQYLHVLSFFDDCGIKCNDFIVDLDGDQYRMKSYHYRGFNTVLSKLIYEV